MSLSAVVLNQASRQIDKYGKTITFIRVTEGAYDRATASVTNSEASTPVKAVVEGFKVYEIANELAEKTDLKVTIAGKNFTAPDTSDKLVIDGKGYRIVSVERVNVQEAVAIYICHAKAA